jgi:hypothetical protein
MTVDPIIALQSIGYTEREAAFLYLVAVHSGCFLRRQFDYFIDRNKGAIAQRFLEKARLAGNIEVIDYGEARPMSGATYRPTPSTYCSKVVDFSTINGSHAHAASSWL